jgi:acetyltransferase-like isoleucine patch superfamily enzyme
MRTGRLWIFGTGAHGRKVCHTAHAAGWQVVGFVDEAGSARSPVEGLALTHPERLPPPSPGEFLFVAIGRADVRLRLMERLAGQGWQFPVIAHPLAWIAPDARVADGVFVAAGAIIETGAVVERGVIIDIGALVDHDCRVGSFCHVRPGQVVAPAIAWPSPST